MDRPSDPDVILHNGSKIDITQCCFGRPALIKSVDPSGRCSFVTPMLVAPNELIFSSFCLFQHFSGPNQAIFRIFSKKAFEKLFASDI